MEEVAESYSKEHERTLKWFSVIHELENGGGCTDFSDISSDEDGEAVN